MVEIGYPLNIAECENYYPQAVSLTAKIKDKKEIEVEFIKSRGGVFEVSLDGQLIFSKKAEERFPEDDEILNQL